MEGHVKVTVYLIPEAHAALVSAAERCGHTRTDTINRALQVYDAATRAWNGDPSTLTVGDVTGQVVGRLIALPPRKRRWWWSR